MVDQDYLARLKEGLEGFWEYICRVMSEVSFENKERGRGGRMLIMMSQPVTDLTVEIEAERLWTTLDREEKPESRNPLPNSVPWKADGGVILKDRKLRFEYFPTDVPGRGVTKDTIYLVPGGEGLYVGLGEFSHLHEDGKRTTGFVKLRKMENSKDFKWAPPGISPCGTVFPLESLHDRPASVSPAKPREPQRDRVTVVVTQAGNVVVGDMSGGEQTSTQTQSFSIGVGDTASLKAALTAIRVPPEDVNDIETIVAEEQPVGKNLGERAAGWVGRMLSKGLTGAWEVGKGVSGDVLSEILLRYYGLK